MSEMTGPPVLALALALALAAGVLLGAFFFGGLWWTVRRGMLSPRPGVWFMGSMLLRTCAVAAGFYFLLGLPASAASGWKIMLAGLLGFIMARAAATRLLPAPLSAPMGERGRLDRACAIPHRER
jgi:F1F0 ATPase subunit 2